MKTTQEQTEPTEAILNWSTILQALEKTGELINKAKQTQDEINLHLIHSILIPFIAIARSISPDIEQADIWTNLTAIIDFLGSVDKVIWISAMIDDALTPPDISPIGGFSWWGLGFGTGFAMLLALAEMRCHKINNIVNQKNNSTLFTTQTQNPSLHWKQKLALSGEAISHVGDIGGRFALYSRVLAITNPWVKLGLHIAGTGLGILGSVAETRTHYNSMLRFNSLFKNSNNPANPDDYQKLEEGKMQANGVALR
jgi:hypothetical protein